MKNGFNGISFPFRISGTGGVQMSSTDVLDVPHIVEAMEQILLTRPYERKMEYHFKSDLDTLIFDPNDISARNMVAYQIKQALSQLEDRIEVINVIVTSEGSSIYATITFRVLMYNTTYSKKIKVGDDNGKTSD
jgi:phage baseplate assembly protein W|nr:MAG TPA: baseplate assembly protein [Caudoviricetes sp.]